jgi:small multidrug resistance pump
MPYLLLSAAIVTEVIGTTLIKYSYGFSRLWPTVGTAVAYIASFIFLAHALKGMAVGTAYAIWSAVGTALIAAIGMVLFDESRSLIKLVGLALVIGGVVVLNLSSAH